jgi:hypothetical protein
MDQVTGSAHRFGLQLDRSLSRFDDLVLTGTVGRRMIVVRMDRLEIGKEMGLPALSIDAAAESVLRIGSLLEAVIANKLKREDYHSDAILGNPVSCFHVATTDLLSINANAFPRANRCVPAARIETHERFDVEALLTRAVA